MTADVRKDLASGRLSSEDLPLSISKRKEWLEYPLKDISQPHPNDVLCGRGGGSNNHPGNEAFRVLVAEVKLPYVNCPKREKPLIARRVVEAVRNQSPPGRFLQKDGKTGLWNDIGDGRAREKTSQALREGAPVIRGKIIDNSAEGGGSAKKGKASPVDMTGLIAPEKKQTTAGSNDNSENTNEAQLPHLPRPLFPDYANQSQLHPLNLPMFQERQTPLPPDMYQSREMSWQQPIPYPPPPSRDEFGAPRFTGGFAQPMQYSHPQHRRRATMDYAPAAQLRHATSDSVPYETVRGLLLGHLDPVKLAYSILSPEDAAAVARLHKNAITSTFNTDNMGEVEQQPQVSKSTFTINNTAEQTFPHVVHQQPPVPLSNAVASSNTVNKPSLFAMVSDGSSSPSECTSMKEEMQSSDESSRQSDVKIRALPKKKRKFIEYD
jgi:hypothetical protein